MTILKNKLLKSQLNSTKLSIEDLKKLIPIVEEANKESKSLEASELKKTYLQEMAVTESDINDYLEEFLTVRVGIFGNDGEYVQTDFPGNLTADKFPRSIKRVVIDNLSNYQLNAKRDPANSFRITLDFQTPSIFDFISSPSLATPNESLIEILGTNETWVNGTYSKFLDFFKDKKTNRSWIHKRNIYDILLWLLLFPIGLGYLRKLDHWISTFEKVTYSPAFFTVFYLFFLLLIFLLFRLLFNYLRWLYPYLELEPQNTNPRDWQRKAYYLILVAVFSPIIYDLFWFLVSTIT